VYHIFHVSHIFVDIGNATMNAVLYRNLLCRIYW